MSSSPYDRDLLNYFVIGSLASARVVLPQLFRFYRPQSIVDIGCGEGAWLRVAKENGVADVLGMDRISVDCDRLLIRPDQFRSCDLNARIQLPRRFDLALSLEVADHLPYDRSMSFVADLCQLSDVVLFSAAMPYQGGTDHINEQWLEFWGILFRKHNYVAYDLLREKVWTYNEVEFWYQQNLVVFVNAGRSDIDLPAEYLADHKGLSYIHPLNFVLNASRWRPLLPDALELEFQDYRALLRAYTNGERELPPLKTLSAHAQLDGAEIDLFPQVRTIITDPAEDLKKGIARNSARQSDELGKRDDVIVELKTYLGERNAELARRAELLKSSNENIEQLQKYLEARNEELERRAELLKSSNENIEHLRKYLEARNVELERRAELLRAGNEYGEQLRRDLEARNAELERLSGEMRNSQKDLADIRNDYAALSSELVISTKRLTTIREERDRIQEAINTLRGSLSWKITAPLRYFSKRIHELRGLSGS